MQSFNPLSTGHLIVLESVYMSYWRQYLTKIILHVILMANNLTLKGHRAKPLRLVKYRIPKGTSREQGLFNEIKNVWGKIDLVT
jgi:hypothetical protein